MESPIHKCSMVTCELEHGNNQKNYKGRGALKDFITVGEAAELLGVSAGTLRNWTKNGKLIPRRNQFNRYRLYRKQDIELILQNVNKPIENE